ncbi:MAG TPA: helix-turn-helix transcriptional regulator [Sporichthya sp.]|nr:helix-turn-helix transcriptional regulator [Sporichthya sp.]
MPPTSHDLSRQRHWVCALQLAERRRMLGLTQQDVVDRLAGMGVAATNRSLSAMEHGQGLDVGRIPELAAALECTVTYLLGLTMDPHRWEPDEQPAPPKLGRSRTGLSRFVSAEEPLHRSPARETARVSGA